MPPNVNESGLPNDPESEIVGSKVILTPSAVTASKDGYSRQLFHSILNLLAHLLIGATVFISLVFSFRGGIPLGATPLHIVLCVIGYQLLMAESILSLSPYNGWSSYLKLVHKRRIHWILQIMGSVLAIAGSIIMSLEKDVNWNTLHGKFALVAMVFTTVSLVNGLTSLYAYELRRLIPSNLSKLTHICFGTVAFVTASVSLCYGFDKNSFKNWATAEVTYTIIAFTAAFTLIIILVPLFTFFNKSKNIITS